MPFGRKPLLAAVASVVGFAILAALLLGQGSSDPDPGMRLSEKRLGGDAPASPAKRPVQAEPNFFSPTSPWNRPLPADAPPREDSAAYVGEMVRQVNESGTWINTTDYSTPVYRVGRNQPRTRVTIAPSYGRADPRQQAALAKVPLPGNAQPAAGTDGHLVVWQPSTDSMWEFWQLQRSGGGWIADSAGAMRNVSSNPGYYDHQAWPGAQTWWGATATALPLVGGLIRISELESGHIEHALALAIPDAAASYVWPAQRSDGENRSPGAIPEGTTFRLPASLDVNSLGLPSAARMIAEAAQKYGMIVRDRSPEVALYAEDPTPFHENPYPRLFGGRSPSSLLQGFPWSKLVAVQQGGRG
jgi:hypothetical protein